MNCVYSEKIVIFVYVCVVHLHTLLSRHLNHNEQSETGIFCFSTTYTEAGGTCIPSFVGWLLCEAVSQRR